MEVRIRLQKAGKASNKAYNYRVVAMAEKKAATAVPWIFWVIMTLPRNPIFSLKKKRSRHGSPKAPR